MGETPMLQTKKATKIWRPTSSANLFENGDTLTRRGKYSSG
jgi:hypothetical protein